MAEDNEVKEVIEGTGATELTEAPKSKEEMRFVEHEYADNKGWCAVCGRSEGWKAHVVKEGAEAIQEATPVDSTAITAPLEVPADAPTTRRGKKAEAEAAPVENA